MATGKRAQRMLSAELYKRLPGTEGAVLALEVKRLLEQIPDADTITLTVERLWSDDTDSDSRGT